MVAVRLYSHILGTYRSATWLIPKKDRGGGVGDIVNSREEGVAFAA